MSTKSEEITLNDIHSEPDTIDHDEKLSTGKETSEQIRQEIEDTRAELTQTIDALQDKLDPNRIKDRAIESTVERVQQFTHSTGEKIAPVAEKAGEVTKKLKDATAPLRAKAREKIPTMLEKAQKTPALMAAVGVAACVIGFAIRRRGRFI
jgi:histone H3/H4